METDQKLRFTIRQYYLESEKSYRGWGKDAGRPDVYALHCGFHPSGQPIDQHESVKLMTRKIIALMEAKAGDRVLDAGCGSGALLFEAAESYPGTLLYGVNIAKNQLDTARGYLHISRQNINLSMQDYLSTAFPTSFFDTILFIESATHAQDKKKLFLESRRIMKTGGKIIISDVFLKVSTPSSEVAELVKKAEEGFILPSIPTIDLLSKVLAESGFNDISIQDISLNVLPSANIMATHAAIRLGEQGDQDTLLSKSRHACIATEKLMRSGALGYFWITATAI